MLPKIARLKSNGSQRASNKWRDFLDRQGQ